MTRILGSGTLDEESLRLLERLADCIQRPQTEVPREAEPVKQVAPQQVTPVGGESVETEPAKMSTGEPSSNGDSERNTEERVIVGSLRTMSEDRWTCKVPSCTGGFTASWIAGISTKWTRRIDSSWQTRTVSAWAV